MTHEQKRWNSFIDNANYEMRKARLNRLMQENYKLVSKVTAPAFDEKILRLFVKNG